MPKDEHIVELMKENAELKERICKVAQNIFDNWCKGDDPCPHLKKRDEQLTKAKNILKYVLNSFVGDLPKELGFFDEEELKAIAEAEQFLKESEVEK